MTTMTLGIGCDRRTQSSDDAPAPPDGVLKLACSSDLRDVVDDSQRLVQHCGADQGCAGGVCVPACEAAAASRGSLGCDFIVATPSFHYEISPPCFAIFLANNWPVDAAISLERGGETYNAEAFGRIPDGSPDAATWPLLSAGKLGSSGVGVLFLSADPESHNGPNPTVCPVEPAVSTPAGTAVYLGASRDQTGIGRAWHLRTSVPVSAYDILPYGGATSYAPSAEVLLPTSAWGTAYVAATPAPTIGAGWGQVIAAENHTTIEITPTVTLPSGFGVIAAPAQQVSTYHLDAGEYIQWQDAGDMSGTRIVADKPVSFTGGAEQLCLYTATSSFGGCDSAHQQIPPVAALGWEYVAAPYATRRADLQEESIRYRFVAVTNGTQLIFDPPLSGTPISLLAGQTAEIDATGAFFVKSQDSTHPFYAAQYMSGSGVSSGSRPGTTTQDGDLGDEEFVNIVPPLQWLSQYVFFTDPTYGTTNLVLVRKASSSGFKDVVVDCVGIIVGWQPVADGREYETTNVDLKRVTPSGTCAAGRHIARSDAPFTVTVWGLDSDASYAYPVGGNVGTINPVVVF